MVTQRAVAVLAVLFGAATVLAGSRVLTGTNPGYVVFRPLLLYNTSMGVVYIAAGLLTWRQLGRGRTWAGAVLLLNLLVLIAIAILYAGGWAIAADSLAAMSFRTAVWGAFFLALSRIPRGGPGWPTGRAGRP